jgi:formamidopyrimidine-DNA glycosylase
VDLLGDSSKFPEEWLFNHRWGKGKKDSPTTLPNGAKITFLTVGGRTSCVVPSIQKKTGAVAGDLKEKGEETQNGDNGSKTGKGKSKKGHGATNAKVEPGASTTANGKGRKRKATSVEIGRESEAIGTDEQKAETKGRAKKSKGDGDATSASAPASSMANQLKDDVDTLGLGRRRSGRLSKSVQA